MTIELPVLRLGLAGFSAQQQEALGAALSDASGHLRWEISAFEEADAWWVNGARTHLVAEGTIRVRAAAPGSRAVQLHLPDIDRPIAFALPLVASALEPGYSFDPKSPESIAAILAEFEGWLAPITAQFCLASEIVENQSALGRGVYDFGVGGRLLAVVDMHGEVGVLPGLDPNEFENAEWHPRTTRARVPDNFIRTTLSQLMWHYSVRTQRDLLPRHYRTGLLYFRRPPRLPARLLQDTHLLLMRELATAPASFEALRMRTGMAAPQLAHALAALYFVGSITSNPKRATPSPVRRDDTEGSLYSQLPSGLDSVSPAEPPRLPPMQDFTAPAPIGPR
ncbi:hypothetical protein [Caenimonas aquaedulcis]|uniref:Uncharacterized protein n=1 Tax=Caenimonas aquaedulcis TaxID=2793270 RepID=A0A931H7I6_9BURK|nr:hypothetical protein [Caenimonas aquaedulcis]MBG9389953.1 hypothetical protein [Caenimonas aquaedulcis]